MDLTLIGANIVMVIAYLLRSSSIPPQIPLFYVHQSGEDQLGEWWMIFLLPIFLDVFYLFNKFMLRRFFPHNKFVNRVVYYFNLFLIVTFTIIFIRIILLIS